MGPKVMGLARRQNWRGLMRKIPGGQVELISTVLLRYFYLTLALYLASAAFCLYSGLDNDRYYAENLLPHAQKKFLREIQRMPMKNT